MLEKQATDDVNQKAKTADSSVKDAWKHTKAATAEAGEENVE